MKDGSLFKKPQRQTWLERRSLGDPRFVDLVLSIERGRNGIDSPDARQISAIRRELLFRRLKDRGALIYCGGKLEQERRARRAERLLK